ncbi:MULTISPECIES: ABC transporter substrate-binding protein [Pseudothermotoga]|jgi:ribose transport system substrate-binding protein|uniref:Periplasmic binding protein/LacI transcriptional regulator n=1 Tax=Pseudothermotoga lettingae (strain ATCC BAA-301 / DSM 14385 / NBRC 107922 / TMO) TaxID=416591 RepID=A8F3L8_PSELT|nr:MULTISPECIES: ABC transporter substrate-binding protein [Pseudothermotoga]ABV32752.1 periplasmic binding protein/LacI transcriptional regulator [Pseudothermotoga lettingae TMO]KUK20189.1 MAG: Periplasmic binding protein/LacI transcriptional regulator [Pseudothermotoga lettingae]GLI48254.1 ABC transporter substrate-binding protein [Pseudothermotoga lettingae TMO]HBJ80481.1 LacI family transcriptional regulator [Pseudothermotoga sp.]HBT26264.1 LacI family transcriptional regulator [Pseudother
MRKFLLVLAMVFTLSALVFGAYEIAFVVKATDSDFWQYTIVGAKNAEHDLQGLVKVTVYGPPSEADIDKQVAILEDVIRTKPDAIVISSTSSHATAPALNKAYQQGIKIILIDNFVYDTGYHSFLATNNKVGGGLAAEKVVELLKKSGRPLKGKVGLISSMAGVQVLIDRDDGFTARLKELAPDLEILPTRYVDNDIAKAAAAAEDLITAYGDQLVAIFADNNHTGDGVARVIEEQNLQDKVIAVAYDSDPQEVEALRNGSLKALIVQDPHGMGYKGVMFAFMAINGETLPSYFDTGVYVVTKENMDNLQWVLDPYKRKKY